MWGGHLLWLGLAYGVVGGGQWLVRGLGGDLVYVTVVGGDLIGRGSGTWVVSDVCQVF